MEIKIATFIETKNKLTIEEVENVLSMIFDSEPTEEEKQQLEDAVVVTDTGMLVPICKIDANDVVDYITATKALNEVIESLYDVTTYHVINDTMYRSVPSKMKIQDVGIPGYDKFMEG